METAKESAKLEKKLNLHMGGYMQRQKMLKSKIGEAAKALQEANSTLGSFKTLQMAEEIAISRRLGSLREEVNLISRRDRESQEAYKKIRDEVDALTATSAFTNGQD